MFRKVILTVSLALPVLLAGTLAGCSKDKPDNPKIRDKPPTDAPKKLDNPGVGGKGNTPKQSTSE